MTADGWAKAVRQQLGLGRVLPLGGPRDGAWITERAAGSFLRRAAASVPGVRPGPLRISPADPDASYESYEPVVPPPPSALPPGPLRIDADFEVSADPTALAAEPLHATAARLRAVLATAATERLGLTVTEVDLRVTGLLEADEDMGGVRPENGPPAGEPAPAREPERGGDGGDGGGDGDDEESRVTATALAVPGVARLTGVLGGRGRSVHIETGAALPRRHVRVELAVTATATERVLDVARAVRAAVGGALPDHPSVAVVVTEVD
ncbi:nucleopolyhedrovirus P10 family protein [Streptomyces phyllanthi]|uniref:Nucleopolyhedrovirus P10 family protein n=1 Tax=Streptomyces phyllanthi TaxID=1803180 RepID=A0A5N8WD94_9ACTN|nr:nucleopolyhedrovirus P10 family protein [Streptomyces phyllanthi]MPY44364.1 nucleopolyhedrovirus P10 family protein [Streptomyces phyllanthi]